MAFYRVDSISFCYREQAKLFDSLSFELGKHERIGFHGPNGTGKTTLVKLMLGILKPCSGKIFLEDKELNRLPLAEIGRRVGFVFQNPDKQLFAATVREQIRFGLKMQGLEASEMNRLIDYWLDYFGMTELQERFPVHLSRGQKQRLILAATFARGADFFIMDEPTTGLDIHHGKLLDDCLSGLRDKEKGYILISHDPAFLKQHTTKLFTFTGEGVHFDEKA